MDLNCQENNRPSSQQQDHCKTAKKLVVNESSDV